VEIRILGPLELWDAERVPLGGVRQRGVLAALLVHPNEVVSTERLVDDLWGESPPRTAAKMIHNSTSQLRRVLGDGTVGQPKGIELLTRSGGYMLRIDPERLDSFRFERSIEDGRNSLHDGDVRAASETLRQALALWRGEPFADLPDAAFLRAERVRLDDLRIAALEYRIEADLALGRHLELIGELEALVAREPLTESFRAYLMLALYRGGRQTEALGVYKAAREMLADELGLEPGPRLQRLERAILQHEPSLGAELRIPAAAATGEAEAEPPRARIPARPVRKTVTVLCASAEIAGRDLDPEALEGITEAWFDRFGTIVRRHGAGTPTRTAAGLVAVFGVPLLREDDAARAARAAAEIHAAARELAAELRPTWGVGLAVRIGLGTGPTVTAAPDRGDVQPASDLATVSAKLARSARPGETMLDRSTGERLDASFRTAAAARGALKLLPPEADAPLLPLPSDTRFLGREWELRQLSDAFRRTAEESTSYLFTVFGTAGIGKSRLAREFAAGLDEPATVLPGRCLSYGEGITFWPIVEMLRHLDPSDPVRAVADAVRDDPDAAAVVEAISAALGLADPADTSAQPAWALRRLFEGLARERPLVLAFDDLQWAEPTLLDLIEHVVESVRDVPMLIVCLARPEFLDDRSSWGGGKLNATSLFLEPLSQRLSETLAAEAAVDLPDEALARITSAAEGNPLFIEQMVAIVRADGVTPRELRVPPTIEALLASRLDRLDAEERELLEAASVVGREFSRSAVVALLPERAQATVLDRAEALVRRELIRPERSPLAGDYGFRFRHGLVQDTAYRSVPKQARSRLHERYADYLAELSTPLPDADEIIAHHLERAYRYRAEIAPLDDEAKALGARAAGGLAGAGRSAYAREDIPAAVSFLARATELLPQRESRRLELLLDLADALRESGDYDRASGVLDEVAAEARASGQARLAAESEVIRLRMRLFKDPNLTMESVRRSAQEAVEVLERARDDRGLGKAWELMAWAPWFECHVAEAEAALARSIEHARRARDRRTESQAMHLMIGAAFFGPLPVEAGVRLCEETLDRFVGQPRVTASALRALAGLNALRGRFDDARGALARASAILSEFGFAVTAASLRETQGLVELLAGDAAAAEEVLRDGLETLERLGVTSTASNLAALLARALHAQGRHREALAFVDLEARPPARDDLHSQVQWRSARATVLSVLGEVDEGERLAREAVALLEDTDVLAVRADALLDLAFVLAVAERKGEARRSVGIARLLYAQKGHLAGVRAAERRLASLDE
jgi:DNA-binding SARP family transcriptional activator